MLADLGFIDVAVGAAVDTFGGAHGEPNARTFDVHGYPFIARKPPAGVRNVADRSA
jgi:hypothetical protein